MGKKKTTGNIYCFGNVTSLHSSIYVCFIFECIFRQKDILRKPQINQGLCVHVTFVSVCWSPDLRTRVDARWRCCSTLWARCGWALWLGWKIKNNISMTKWQIWTPTAFCVTGHRTDMRNAVADCCYTSASVFPSVSPLPWFLFWILFRPTSWPDFHARTPFCLTHAIHNFQTFNLNIGQSMLIEDHLTRQEYLF